MRITLAAIALVSLAASAYAGPPTAPAAPKPVTKAAPLICPVTGETIASAKDAVGSSVYKGKTYYFCCGSCKPMFDKNPTKYTKAVAKPAVTPKAAKKA